MQQGGAQSQLVGANTWSTGFESKALWIESYSMSSSQISSAERIITAMVAVTVAVAVTATKTERAHVQQQLQAALPFGYRRPRCLAGQVADWRTATVVMAAAAVRHRPRPRHHYLDSYLRHLQPLMQTDDSDLNLMSARR